MKVSFSQQPAYLKTMYDILSESATQALHDGGVYTAIHTVVEEKDCVLCGSKASPAELVPAAK